MMMRRFVKLPPITRASRRAAVIAAVIACALVAPTLAQSPTPDVVALQQQLEKFAAGQDALRKEMQVMQRQLQELRALLQPRPQQPAADQTLPAELSIAGAPVKGAANAALTIVEFSDFECPFCGRYVRETHGQIEKDYIATGKVRYVFRHFPLERIHPLALKAGEAAACAGAQGKFWEMHARLFANQKELLPDNLVTHGHGIGLNDAQFKTCLSGEMTQRVRQDLALGASAGVTSTPTFFIGVSTGTDKIKVLRRVNGAAAFTTFKLNLDGLLAAQTATP
jgi:protein-disulfide isomerase